MHIRQGKLSEGVLAAAIRLQPYYWKETKRSEQAAMTHKLLPGSLNGITVSTDPS